MKCNHSITYTDIKNTNKYNAYDIFKVAALSHPHRSTPILIS